MDLDASEPYCPYDVVSLERVGFEAHIATTPYGNVWFYVRRAAAGTDATVMLHGVASDASTWSPLLKSAELSGTHLGNLVLVDLSCFGRSENKLGSMHIDEVGRMIVDEVALLGFSDIRLVGHSMGGFLALDMASRFANRISSVHVAAGSYFGILNTIKRPITNLFTNPRTGILWDTYWVLCLTGSVGTRVVRAAASVVGPRAIIRPFVADAGRMRRQVIDVLLSQLNPRGVVLTAKNGPKYDAIKAWGDIRAPIVAVFGREDPMVTSWDERELLRVNDHARTAWVDNASHMLVLERPAAVLKALEL